MGFRETAYSEISVVLTLTICNKDSVINQTLALLSKENRALLHVCKSLLYEGPDRRQCSTDKRSGITDSKKQQRAAALPRSI
jgi:hypothetical protein